VESLVENTPLVLPRRSSLPRNENCGGCGGSGADSSGKSCGTCNGLGEIYCRVSRRGLRVPSHSVSVISKEGR